MSTINCKLLDYYNSKYPQYYQIFIKISALIIHCFSCKNHEKELEAHVSVCAERRGRDSSAGGERRLRVQMKKNSRKEIGDPLKFKEILTGAGEGSGFNLCKIYGGRI